MTILSIYIYAANEVCDRFASAGFHSNLMSYLTQELNMPLVAASNTLTNFGGTSSFTPLIGALFADSFAGRYWTIIVGCLIYELVSYPLFHNINLLVVYYPIYFIILMKLYQNSF
jgi:dipeptide/tripeptide permease